MAAVTLRETEANADSANSARNAVSFWAEGSTCAVTSTSRRVSASNRSGALKTRSRIWWNDSVWASSSRLAFAADTTTLVSRSRRSGSGSGTVSSSFCRTAKACWRVVRALSTAAANVAVCDSPNSSTASTSSLALVRTALSTSTTRERDSSSSAPMGTDARAPGSVGSRSLAAAISASWRRCRRRRLHSIRPPITTSPMPTRITSGASETLPPPDGLLISASPPAAAVAAPAQSPSVSAGTILSRRMLSTFVELPPAAALGTTNP